MKKIVILIAILSIGTLSSCGTSSYYSSNYEDGIYYTPDKSLQSAQIKDEEELENLSRATRNRRMSGSLTDTIFLSKDNNHVEIAHTPNSSYVVLLDGESYEDRLNKFNDDTYSFSIDFALEDPYAFNSWSNPWWGGRYGRYSNSWYGWGGPYFGMNFGYGHGWGSGWGPGFGFGWGGGWGGGYGFGWGSGWNNPWYSGWYGYGSPWYPYPPMHYPSYGIVGKDVYYGKRNPSNRGRSAVTNVRGGSSRPSSLNQIRGNSSGERIYTSSTGRRAGGSVSGTSSGRRSVNYSNSNTPTYNSRPAVRPSGSGNTNVNTSAGSKYRRSATTVSRSPASTNRSSSTYNSSSSRNNNTQAAYNRSSNNTSNRSSYSSSSRSSSSSSSSMRSSSSGSSTRSSSSGGRR